MMATAKTAAKHIRNGKPQYPEATKPIRGMANGSRCGPGEVVELR
jgi:hypothetical protein